MHDCNLKIRNIIVLAIALTPLRPLHAQNDCGDECKINSNLAMVVNVPVNPTAQAVGTGWGIVGGAGYNFNKHNAVIGEFMWNRVYASGGLGFWTILEVGNGIGHLAIALSRAGYFPGVVTAPLLVVFALWLAILQNRQVGQPRGQ